MSDLCSEGRNALIHRKHCPPVCLGRNVGLLGCFISSMNFKVHTVSVVFWLKCKYGTDLEPDTVELPLLVTKALKGQSSQPH